MLGSPMPTNTMSPSRSSAAAAQIISSVAIVDATAHSFRGRPASRNPGQVLGAIAHAVNVFVQIADQTRPIARDLLPPNVELVVAIIVALNVRGMRAPRLVHHRVHDES